MKYFLDTEFIEGFHNPLFGKRRHFIDLISIGVVAEDGRSYYAISTGFNARLADKWVKENVIAKLPPRFPTPPDSGGSPRMWEESFAWKSQTRIVTELCEFFGVMNEGYGAYTNDRQIEIYAYYADYDWVLFCSLFGRMIDLPEGFPMYCRDLKQMFDEYCVPSDKTAEDYPTQEKEHNALDDARWNYRLYQFIQNLKNGHIQYEESDIDAPCAQPA